MSRKMPGGIDLLNQPAINFVDPTTPTGAATKQYVDNRVGGIAYKDEVRLASTANGTLSTAFAAGQSLDGGTLAAGDSILLLFQTNGADNGIYTVNASGAPTRRADADTTADLNMATVYVVEGTVNGGKEFNRSSGPRRSPGRRRRRASQPPRAPVPSRSRLARSPSCPSRVAPWRRTRAVRTST
jgi:hypothetical protein